MNKKVEYLKNYYERNKEKLNLRSKLYYEAHKEDILAWGKLKYRDENIAPRVPKIIRTEEEKKLRTHKSALKYRVKVKAEVLSHYGNNVLACVKCGYNNPKALSIDHINGGGNEHRRSLKGNIYQWLKQTKFPEGYKTLCMNCQWEKK